MYSAATPSPLPQPVIIPPPTRVPVPVAEAIPTRFSNEKSLQEDQVTPLLHRDMLPPQGSPPDPPATVWSQRNLRHHHIPLRQNVPTRDGITHASPETKTRLTQSISESGACTCLRDRVPISCWLLRPQHPLPSLLSSASFSWKKYSACCRRPSCRPQRAVPG